MAAPGPRQSHSADPWNAPSRLLTAAALLIPVITAILLSWHSLGILDIWLHNKVGQDILAGDGIPGTNTYSFVEPDHPWTDHEWLFQVLVGAMGPDAQAATEAGIARWNALRLLLGALLAGALVLGDGNLTRLLGKRPGSPALAWLVLPVLLGLLLLWSRIVMRPELISYLFFVLMVRLADQPAEAWPRPVPVWRWFDPRHRIGGAFWLTVAWAQFHGFAALAPVILLLSGVSHTLEASWSRAGSTGAGKRGSSSPGRWWLAAVPAALVGLCLTPTGVQGLLYPLRALGQFTGSSVDLRSTISELVPLLETRDSLALTMTAYKVSLVWGLIWVIVTWGGTSLLRVLLWLAGAWAAYAGQRNIGFYALTFILLHTGTTSAPLLARWSGFRHKAPSLAWAGLATLIALAVAIPWWQAIRNDDFYLGEGVSRRFGAGVNEGRYPEASAQLLAARPGLHLFTNVDGAAYLLDRADSRLFIDGRTEAYSLGHWAAYEQIKRADARSLDRLGRYHPQGAFISTSSGAFGNLCRAMLKSVNWELVHLDATGFLYRPARDDAPASGSGTLQKDLRTLAGQLPARGMNLTSARAGDLCLAQAATFEIAGDAADREAALRRGLEFRPDHPALQHNLGNILMSRNDLSGARDLFLGALDTNPRLSGSALNAGVCSLKLREPERARDLFRLAVRINPGSFEGWANLGTAWLTLGDRAESVKALERALELQPGNPRITALLRRAGSR